MADGTCPFACPVVPSLTLLRKTPSAHPPFCTIIYPQVAVSFAARMPIRETGAYYEQSSDFWRKNLALSQRFRIANFITIGVQGCTLLFVMAVNNNKLIKKMTLRGPAVNKRLLTSSDLLRETIV
jgi:hypothetical protein